MNEKQAPLANREVQKIYTADDVHSAITDGKLVNYYQARVDTATGNVIGVETLVRWIHPQDGMILPEQFIGVAEAHGIIDDLARMVLTGALAQAEEWQKAGLTLQVAVNLSVDNLGSLDFMDWVVGLVNKAGVPPQKVVLEISASHLTEYLHAPLKVLAQLHLKRFRLSIDDFVIGNSPLLESSMSNSDLAFDELHIDQSIVHGAWNSKKLQAMFDSSLALARKLGMSVVAEGVEDKADWDFVRKAGCETAQGYFIAKPMPANDLPGWMRSWRITE